MADKENEKILGYRNQTSMLLDDLVALVRDDTLAGELRVFSSDVMELKPGFAFGLKQAKELKDLTERTLRQYAARAIRDDDLIRYSSEARMVLQGEDLTNGGRHMGLLDKAKQTADKMLHGKEIKKQQNIDQMEKMYRETCEKIMACEQEMTRCVQESRGLSPDSMKYRNNERSYMNAKNNMILLRKSEAQIRKLLDETDRRKMIEDYNKLLKGAGKIAGDVLGDEKSFSEVIASVEVYGEKLSSSVENMAMMGTDLFEMNEEDNARADNPFKAEVAAEERRYATMASAGVSEDDLKQAAEPQNSEFASLVGSEDNQ